MNTTKHILILLALMALSTAAWAQGLQGTGSSTDPYLINNNTDWETFAQSVTDGTTYAGQFVKLTADISTSVMAGSHTNEYNYNAFSGTFDGDGHTITLDLSGSGEGIALFSDIEDATLKNLKAQGTVTTDDRRPATFAIFVAGNSTISNCLSTVDVSSTRSSGWVDGGGFVGRVHANDTLNMTGCAFQGSVTFTNGATTGGGMVGYTQNNATVNLTDCLYSPSALTLNVNAYNPRIFVSGEVAGNLTNCYYNDVAAASVLENEGKQAFSITGINGANVGFSHSQATIYNVSSIIAYSVGMAFAGTYYAGETETVSLWLTHDNHPGYTYGDGYIASAGTLTPLNIIEYTLTMPNEDVTIAPVITAYTVSVACYPNIADAAQVSLDNTTWSSSVSAAVGDVVYFKSNSVIGYYRAGYTIETEFGEWVDLTDNHFTMPAANVTYYVDFSPSSAYIGDYTVILSPGEGTGDPIVYPFEPATAAPNAASAENLQFYYVNYNTIGFRLPYDYCPSSFTAPNGVYFIGWDGWSNNGYITLTSTETTFTAQWGNPMPPLSPGSYIDGNGEYHTCNNYTVLTGGQGATTLEGGWYVVDSDITYSNNNGVALTLHGDVTLILCNGKTMTVTAERIGIDGNGHSLTIYGQSLDPNVAGTLNVNSASDYAIDWLSTYTQHSGKVIVSSPDHAIFTQGFTLNGGSLQASGKYCGIDTYNGGDLTINGGTVTATSTQTEEGYAGISGGGNVVINGGKVEANKIFAYDNITLGYTHADDYIKADNFYYAYSGSGTVSVKSGQFFYYKNGVENVTVSGTIANPNSSIAGKTLRPYIVPITVTKEIAGHSTGDGGWHLIASPLQGNNYVEYVSGLISNTASHYDLYRFNQDANKEWENYKANSPTNHPDFITLRNGRGYLYAHSTDTTLTFTGAPYIGSGVVDLNYSTLNPNDNMHGWNLVGNPFGTAATLGTTPFYRMNAAGTEIIASETSTVAAMEGIFVKATATGQSVTFTQATRATDNDEERIVLNLSHGGAVIDRAIVRFGEGQTLPKFQMRENSTKIYIPQEGTDYAVAVINSVECRAFASEAKQSSPTEQPIHFKPAENGTYTLTAYTNTAEMSYLHLVDNMTGADIDLLTPPAFGHPLSEGDVTPPAFGHPLSEGDVTPPACGHPLSEGDLPLCKGGRGDSTTQPVSYTFTAKTTDYASRFKLVFSISGNADGDNEAPFAYVSNGNIVITADVLTTSNASHFDASLQVIDVMGRVLVSVGGHTRCVPTAGMPAGVYVLRLIDGDNVRTQKIVIK